MKKPGQVPKLKKDLNPVGCSPKALVLLTPNSF